MEFTIKNTNVVLVPKEQSVELWNEGHKLATVLYTSRQALIIAANVISDDQALGLILSHIAWRSTRQLLIPVE